MSEKYNGWTNYETWRVNLEMVDPEGYHLCLEDWHESSTPEELRYDLAQVIRDNCTDIIEQAEEGLARDYALAFLDSVEWREIARHIVDDWIQEKNEG